MSRQQRRSTQGSARSRARDRRTPVKAQGRGGASRIPWTPLIAIVGVAAVVGLVGYLIWQATQPASDSQEKWVRVEADSSPDIPGEYVNLPEIYDGNYGPHGNNATAPHVNRDVDYVEDGNTNPPTGGPHWGSSACGSSASESPAFCGPAQWGIYSDPDDAWEPETLVHNMEHGGVVVWYNTTDEAIIDELQDMVADIEDLLVLSPYPDMEEEHIAVTSWTRIDKFPVSEFDRDRVENFINENMRRFNPEGF